MIHLKSFVAALTLATMLASQANAKGYRGFEFALIGDVPYKATDYWKFDNVIKEINSNKNLKWVLHAGDIKRGSTLCTDEIFLDRFKRFQRFEKPFILTPGDNEWTDCHRANNGVYQPLERLTKLRTIFFPVPGLTLGQKPMAVETQGGVFVENIRWREQHVMFATLHIVGSNNGLAPFPGRSPADDAEVVERVRATVAWIDETFAKAQKENMRGVLLLFQANPGFDLAKGSSRRRGFEEVLEAFERGALDFGKPVVLAHGDSHYFRVDKPMKGSLSNRRIENITRVESFGANDVHWLRIVVDPNSPEVFSVHQQIVSDNLENHR